MKQTLLLYIGYFCACILSPLAHATSYNLGGLFTTVQVQVADLHKDAELIGLSKDKIAQEVERYLRNHKISVTTDGKKAALSVRITTLDVGPRVVSHISLELKEPGRLSRHPNPVFVTSWSKGSMVASEPTKHEAMLVKSLQSLIDSFVRASLE